MKGYICLVLTEEDKNKILSKVSPTFKDIVNHHITYHFNIDKPEKFDILPDVKITGICRGEDIECLTVTVDGKEYSPDNRRFHITFSKEEWIGPFKSNDILNTFDVEELEPIGINPEWSFVPFDRKSSK